MWATKNNISTNVSLINRERGFSLIEALISLSIISLSVFFFMQFIGGMYDNMERADTRQIAGKFKDGFVEKILLQIPTDAFYSNPIAILDKNQKLPSAWSHNGDLINAKSCSKNECFGRVGYWVSPVIGYPGIYHITVQTKYEGKDETYTMLVRLK